MNKQPISAIIFEIILIRVYYRLYISYINTKKGLQLK